MLTGLSFEINKSALLNIGRAFAVNDKTHDKSQTYFGITIDQNYLKEIGITTK